MGERRRYHNFVFDSARWDGFELRDDDIIVSTPAKCGTTWMQMMCALLVLRTPELPEPLAVLSPWLDMNTRPIAEVRADLDRQEHRRIIKTHTPLDGLPRVSGVTYVHVARDPRDVAQSWDNHAINANLERLVGTRVASVGTDDFEELGITGLPPAPSEDPVERFWDWIESDVDTRTGACMAQLVEHVTTFWQARESPGVALFHYRDLRADLAGEMARLASVLGVDPPTDELVEAATFESMKGRADQLVPNADIALWHDNSRFFDRARAGDWRELFGDDGEQRYERRINALASPDLVAWLHEGWLGIGDARASST